MHLGASLCEADFAAAILLLHEAEHTTEPLLVHMKALVAD